MSKINAVRIINLNYNNNAIKISDEVFHMNGQDTLLSLRNGGGKSVLVQMMTAPFVHKRYRDAKDRPFASYFTTGKPTFILVEWKLDSGAGYVLTGLMVRKNQDFSDVENEQKEELEIVGIVSEYKNRCEQDIFHLPVVEKTKKEMILKNFGACKQLFEVYKRDRSMEFFYYDMNNSAQSRQYFEKLQEYQIYYKEWETIIKKVNLKESGLSELFSDCRSEKDLVDKWFLDAVESKLNKDRNRMKEFQSIIQKYVGQYQDNRSKIERRDAIRCFREEGDKIQEAAEAFQEASQHVGSREDQIAGLIGELNRLRDLEEALQEQVQSRIEEISRQREHVNYEKLSNEFYILEQEERFHSSNRDMIDLEREAVGQEIEKIQRTLHLLECAKQQETADEEQQALEEAKQRIEASKQKEEVLEPERKALGGALKIYYESQLQEKTEEAEKNTAKIHKVNESLEQVEAKETELQENMIESAGKISRQKERLLVFDQTESHFNRQYHQNFARNILGEYEPGAVTIQREAYEKEMEELSRRRIGAKKTLGQQQEMKRSLERKQEDDRKRWAEVKLGQQTAADVYELFEKELAERKIILRYLEMGEEQLFDTKKILAVSERKLQEIDGIRRNREQEETQLKKEFERLSQGKVLELPDEFSAMLESLGIHYIYGMEWLKKNGRKPAENQRLVENLPFLPYGLILSRQELKKLENYGKQQDGAEVYTSFPIPMILREELEQETGMGEHAVIAFDQIRFYVYFNQHLLDEDALKQMLAEKQRQIEKISGQIAQKKEEYKGYFERQEKIKNQKVTASAYQENKETAERLKRELNELEETLSIDKKKLSDIEQEIQNNQQEILQMEKETERQERRLEDFREFAEKYEKYLEERQELEYLKKQEERLKEQKRFVAEQKEKLLNTMKTLENARFQWERLLERIQESCKKYAGFSELETAKEEPARLSDTEIREMEARFLAITSGLSMERQVTECRRRYDKVFGELKYLQEKYHFAKQEWSKVHYQREEERHQESLLESQVRKEQQKSLMWNEEDKKTAVLRQQMKEKKGQILKELGQTEPLPKSEIVIRDFDSFLNQFSVQEKELWKEEEKHGRKISSYEGNLTSLSEYNHLEGKEEIVWEQDFTQMSRKELDAFKGELVRDYRQSREEERERRSSLERLLNQILRMDCFQEDFYRKPLEAMLELSKDASQVLTQLHITIQSYQSLMDKLEIDISMVEKEKKKIVELLEDYLKDVHGNLGKIDHNSTITIREKPVKMLKIQIPDWQENEALFQVRISDFMDEITQKGIRCYEKNENAEEYFGTQLTTKRLYDTVVGIGNVQIRLYKIEAQREYPITWADVARNSGGEGFLSAFVILSSLLYYMRRDDSDFFADRNEGKVLVMDNPFAQTNAAHLLKPLMDMAKKSNTQLICLSGLGGDSIYNRFDNIYVLNLIAASLRNGVQYVRTEHVKGMEAETMIASRIEVTEQMELEF